MSELSDSERLVLARENAADRYEPPKVADVSDVLRMPRDSFVAGWDAAVEHLQTNSDIDGESDDNQPGPVAVLGGPTNWRNFVETLTVEKF